MVMTTGEDFTVNCESTHTYAVEDVILFTLR